MYLIEKEFSEKEAKEIGKLIDIDFSEYDLEQFRMGLSVELEHSMGEDDVIRGDNSNLAKIVRAHLKELPDYYSRLKKMEHGVEEDIANSVGSGGVATYDPLMSSPKRRKKRFKNFTKL